ncbi:MAG: hypothetical protein CL610_12610 [Anaerolineaceae bacterium]|nr:hypothetical protein [Anaerolineaceae bacterium]
MKEVEKALDWVALNRASLTEDAEVHGHTLAAEILVLEQLVRFDPTGANEFPGLTALFLLKIELYHLRKM